MSTDLKYVPVIRVRTEEQKILTTFDFGKNIYPCLEIIKELDRKPVTMRKGKPVTPKPSKTFEEIYLPTLKKINSKKIFLDLPVHMDDSKKVKPEVLLFLRKVVANRKVRTDYIKKFKSLSHKVIPVVSTYSARTGEPNSIKLQENDLRTDFPVLAFRTFPESYKSDLLQIEAIAKKNDYLIMDLNTFTADPEDEDVIPIIERLEKFKKCHIIIIRSAIKESTTNVGLDHGKRIADASNKLLESFKSLHGDSFGDYAGIKKDGVHKGGSISPGFIFYDSVTNTFYGYRGSDLKELEDFETIIVPDVLKSKAALRMKTAPLPYLSSDNKGWRTILQIERGNESGKSMAKFKRIAMEHYLHCVKTKINAGEI